MSRPDEREAATRCPDEAEIALLDSGGLVGPRIDEIRGHVGACITCSGRWAGGWRTHVTSPEPEGAALGLGLLTPPGYEIVREIHRGGQGLVHEAIQVSTRRHVALKVLHATAEDEAAWHRFEREVELASQLRHPNVITIHDSGTVGGHPWIAMELVDGEELDRHVARTRPSRPDVLALFRKLCDAVQHAHSRAVLHRDLKARNVLVDRQGEPRVLDFGIARSLAAATFAGGPTAPGDFVGTLSHAAPEQLRGEAAVADVRADVYALGVILHQLLTARLPHEGEDVAELVRRILEEPPAPPSALDASIPPDLDAIVLKCLAPKPADRYASVHELDRDVASFLAGEPIEARRTTMLAVLAGRARHYRAAALVAGAFVAVLTVSVAWIARERGRAAAAAQEARREQEVSSRVAGFLAQVFLGGDILAQTRPVVTALELVDVAQNRLEDVSLDPESRAYLAGILAHVYVSNGELERGEELLEEALRGELALHAPDHEHVTSLIMRRGDLHFQRGELAPAARWLERALAVMDPSDHETRLTRLEAVRLLSAVRVQQGREADARAMLEEWLARETDPNVRANLLGDLARVHDAAQRFDEAEALLREALAVAPDADTSLITRISLTTLLGQVLLKQGKPVEAETEMRQSLTLRRQLYSQDTVAMARAMSNLAVALRQQDRNGEAEGVLREAIAIQERVEGRKGPFFATLLTNLAIAVASQDRKDESVPLLREAVALTRADHGDRSPLLAKQLGSLAALSRETGHFEEAEIAAREMLRILIALHGDADPRVAPAELRLGQALLSLGRRSEAEPLLVRARARYVEHGGERAPAELKSIDTALATLRSRG